MKKSELKSIVRGLVKEALDEELQTQVKSYAKNIVKVYTPMIVKETCEDMIMKTLSEMVNAPDRPSLNESTSLSHLMRSDDEIRTLTGADIYNHEAIVHGGNSIDRQKIAGMMGYGDSPHVGASVHTIVDDAGNERSIPSSQVPPSLNAALNRNYSELLRAVDEKVKNRRGG